MKSEFRKRVEALLWACFGMGLAAGFEYLGENLGVFNLGVETTVFVGLVINQITKAIYNQVK